MKCIICSSEIKEKEQFCKVCGWKTSNLIDSNILLSHLTKEEIQSYQESIRIQQEVFLTREILNAKLESVLNQVNQLTEKNETLEKMYKDLQEQSGTPQGRFLGRRLLKK